MINQQTTFDKQAQDYNELFGLNSFYEKDIEKNKTQMLNRMSNGENSLYIGCGTGENLKLISTNSKQVIGVDISNEMLKESKKQIIKHNLKNVKLIQASAYDLPFENKSFDRVYCINTFFHLKNRKKAISEISRVTKNNGLVYLEMYSLINFPCLIRRIFNPILLKRPKVYPSYIPIETINLIEKDLIIRQEDKAIRKKVIGKPTVFFFICRKQQYERLKV